VRNVTTEITAIIGDNASYDEQVKSSKVREIRLSFKSYRFWKRQFKHVTTATTTSCSLASTTTRASQVIVALPVHGNAA
jgi:hypothetical protein